ncbi:hypothetical protein N0V94_004129 [Neodidymelliopsis sp. IMI 364377]|nr:hypothetical protein N0V94_004129 [Neodidymelliopsis sp. IMI 364377]
MRIYHAFENDLQENEKDYVYCKEDLSVLRHGREGATFEGRVEDFLRLIDCRTVRVRIDCQKPEILLTNFQWLFRTPELTKKTMIQNIHYYSLSRIRFAVNLIIAFIIILLIAAPIFAMYKLSTFKTERATYAAVGVLMLSTVIFAATMSLLTKAGRHELFAASAAYCAVLVVFIGSTTP